MSVMGQDVEVAAALLSPVTLRLSVLPAGHREIQPIPLDGALVASAWAPEAMVSIPGTWPTVDTVIRRWAMLRFHSAFKRRIDSTVTS